MPSAESISTSTVGPKIVGGNPAAKTRCLEPMVYSGSLERFTYADITPVIGREYEGLQVTELLSADDAMIKDLASISKHSIFHNLGRINSFCN
jgi:hypothetical protein